MAKPIKVTILGDVQDLLQNVKEGEAGIAGFAQKLGAAAGDVAKTATKFAAAGLAAGGIGAVIGDSLERAELGSKLAAQLGATAEESQRYGAAAGALFSRGYGESFAQVNDAIGAVVSTLGRFGSQKDLEAVTAKAVDLATAFDLEVSRAVASSGVLLKTGLAADANQAFDLITKGLQGVPAAVREDLLDASDEYSVFFSELGFSGEEAFGVLSNAAKGGKIALDKSGDAIKEFHIRSTDMSASSIAAYKALGFNAEDMARKIHGGGEGAKIAFQQIVDGIGAMKDPIAQSNTAVALFGTQFEDLANLDALRALSPASNALKDVAGAAEDLGRSLHDNAAAKLESFQRSVSTAFVDIVGGRVLPLVERAATWLSDHLAPAVALVDVVIGQGLIPVLSGLAGWIGQNQTLVMVIAGVITAVFLPALVAWGVTSTVSGAKSAAAWGLSKIAAVQSALAQSAAALTTAGRWVLLGTTSTVQAARVVGAWTLARAGSLASAAVMVASMATTAASVAAGWVLMGTQALIRAGQMAAAWVMAMGPVAWVIAAVIALVALIIANWDWVKARTAEVWSAITGAVRSAVQGVLNVIGWIADIPDKVSAWFGRAKEGAQAKLGQLVAWARGVPGDLLGALGDFGSMLLRAGGDLLSGLWRGIQNAAGWLKDKIIAFFKSLIPDWIKDALGIHSPSRVMASIGRWIPPGLAVGIERTAAVAVGAATNLARDVASAVERTDLPTPGVEMGVLSRPRSVATAPVSRVPERTETRVPTPVTQAVTVNVESPADPHRIAREVAWAIRNPGR
ncbi:hypothetical protein JOD54_001100 [Actinokineospora baliensis]|uniref:phage tail tape measure protein n=1 Tax=Actinokineospora baliensis TaxID=547056 RepID=UPI00195927A4|nr:phage tail tape measure protein [Actinokineospora baliensis]MBM7770896.1 hypothetical protein [Actinokineospora baliensis]